MWSPPARPTRCASRPPPMSETGRRATDAARRETLPTCVLARIAPFARAASRTRPHHSSCLLQVRSFIELAFECIGVTILWKGKGVDEIGYSKEDGRELVKIDPKYFRPTEVELLIGDPTKAKEKLGWVPTIAMQQLCKEMVEADIKLVEKGDLTS